MPPDDSAQVALPAIPTSRWRLAVEWAIVGLTGTGVLWLLARFVFGTETEFGYHLPSWAARVLAIHGGIAMLSLVAIGAWMPVHVVPRLQRRNGLVTGVLQLGLLAVLAVSGFGLYYLADESSRPTWSVVHWVAGLVLASLLLVHRKTITVGRR